MGLGHCARKGAGCCSCCCCRSPQVQPRLLDAMCEQSGCQQCTTEGSRQKHQKAVHDGPWPGHQVHLNTVCVMCVSDWGSPKWIAAYGTIRSTLAVLPLQQHRKDAREENLLSTTLLPAPQCCLQGDPNTKAPEQAWHSFVVPDVLQDT